MSLTGPRDHGVRLCWQLHLQVLLSIAINFHTQKSTSELIFFNWSPGDTVRNIEQNVFNSFVYFIW